MTRKGWISVGSTAALAGAFALALAQTPATAPPVVAAATPDPATAPAPAVIASPVVATPLAVAPAARTIAADPAPGVVPGSAGMIIAIDPETGSVGMPTDAQLEEFKLHEGAAASRTADGLVPVIHANGTVSVELDESFQEYAIVRRSVDGKVTFGCIDHPADLEYAQTAPTALEEE